MSVAPSPRTSDAPSTAALSTAAPTAAALPTAASPTTAPTTAASSAAAPSTAAPSTTAPTTAAPTTAAATAAAPSTAAPTPAASTTAAPSTAAASTTAPTTAASPAAASPTAASSSAATPAAAPPWRPGDDLAARLRTAVAAFGAPFGAESSVKLSPGRAALGRRLFSMALTDLAADPRTALDAAAAAIGAPEAAAATLRPYAGAASHVHFGAEPPATLKLYLEFATPPPRGRDLAFLAAKWRLGSDAPPALATYARLREPIPQAVARLAPAELRPTLLALASRASPAARALEVAEPPTPRRSLDLNLYDADAALSDVSEAVEALHAALDAPGGTALLQAHGAEPLGHVAAGFGRDGAPFATLYFGAGPG